MIKRALFCTLLAACATDAIDDLGATEQAIGPTAGIGDINRDGLIDGKDAANWLHAWGFELYTYGLTDDTYNLGSDLQRREWDWQVKTYGDSCTPHGHAPFPVGNIPHLLDMANAYARMPTQYLRELGREGYGLFFFGDLGRFHKRWTGTANGEDMQLIFYRSGSATIGKGKFGDRDWETLTAISMSGSTLKFTRPSVNEVFTGLVDTAFDGTSNGGIYNGTFTYNGNTFRFLSNADYRSGATTERNGFGDQPGCAPDHRDDEHGGTWSLGTTPPGIQLMVGTVASPYGVVHELGHAIRWLVEDHRVGFTAADASRLLTTIPLTGNPAAACSGCTGAAWDASLPGTGYVTHYAASNGQEDFAEMWANYIYDPNKLQSRIDVDAPLDPLHKLVAKRDFMQHVIDGQEPGIGAAISPVDGVARRFTATNSLIPTRLTPGVASDEASSVWLFVTGTDNAVKFNQLGAGSSTHTLSLTSDLAPTPAYIAPGVMAVFAVQPGAIAYRLLNAAGTAIGNGTLALTQPPRSMAAATLAGATHLFVLDGAGNITKMRITYSGGTLHAGPWIAMDNEPTSSIAAARVGNTIELVEIDRSMRLRHRRMDLVGAWSAWVADPVPATATAVGIDGAGTSYIKGFDGKIYSHALGTTAPYVLQSGL